ncbi:hypothetical protein C8D77_12817 [Mesorhizobium loti]|uniref:Uncharacterized protein n=1 Tax=Rhizobium loti TaxID=381 RepID=A0A8E2W5A5_RHILI|nr:hypothetical protein C8D77_12817 [Mesorhizobium loti]
MDADGNRIVFQKQDGASMLRLKIAAGKGLQRVGRRFGSRWLDKAATR